MLKHLFITLWFLLALFSFKESALACDFSFPDSDLDGVPDCMDGCPDDFFNSTPPATCGCGYIEFDVNADSSIECVESCNIDLDQPSAGFCGCPLFDFLSRLYGFPIGPTCTTPPLKKKTVITEPPGVLVVEDELGEVTVTLFFQQFKGAVVPNRSSRVTRAVSAATNPKLTKLQRRYEALIYSESAPSQIIRKTAKKNELALKGLKPGNYSTKYRGFGIKDGKVAFRTNFSPVKSFTVPE